MESIYILFLYFCICSFIGWVIESVFGTIREKKFVNSGFLYGPFVSIYGFGGIALYFSSTYLSNLFFPVLLIIYFLIPTLIEYFTSFLLEKIFHLRMWDYSNKRFNINGRVCILYSLFWWSIALFGVFIMQPFFIGLLNRLPIDILYILFGILFVYLIIDFIFSIRLFYHLSKIKDRMKEAMESEVINPAVIKLREVLDQIKNSKSLIFNLKKEFDLFIEKLK